MNENKLIDTGTKIEHKWNIVEFEPILLARHSREFTMFISIRDIASFATISLLLTGMFMWGEILSTVV